MDTRQDRRGAALARAQGLFNIAGGLWPLVHPRSFEKIFGPKTDWWLERTVAGLLVGAGWSQLRAASSPQGVEHARRIGVATAATLLAVDLTHVPTGRIRPTYLLDAAMEAGWIRAWLGPRPAAAPAVPTVRVIARPRSGAAPAAAAALVAGCAGGAALAARLLRGRSSSERAGEGAPTGRSAEPWRTRERTGR
ncbi:hypothetical protein [Microbispora sp. NPDC049125]|uniref:hypothetical protein n=1 Tax=Microbispora sp. NPDC049125 TaxID=3154929 RepID=UPI0034675570